jgi:hypothetical protein
MKELEQLAQIFQEAATKVSEENARQPRVDTCPRVQTGCNEELEHTNGAKTPRVDAQTNDDDEVPPLLRQDDSEWVTDGPRYMTRNQKRLRGSITTDVMLTVMELSKPKMSAQQLAARRFPLEFL